MRTRRTADFCLSFSPRLNHFSTRTPLFSDAAGGGAIRGTQNAASPPSPPAAASTPAVFAVRAPAPVEVEAEEGEGEKRGSTKGARRPVGTAASARSRPEAAAYERGGDLSGEVSGRGGVGAGSAELEDGVVLDCSGVADGPGGTEAEDVGTPAAAVAFTAELGACPFTGFTLVSPAGPGVPETQ